MTAVAIDGPAGAGKSTIARAVACALGFVYVDTGALYRAIGYYAVQKGVPPDDPQGVGRLLPEIRLDIRYENGVQRILLGGEDVSERIRTPEMGMAASQVSAQPAVRDFLLETQREMARRSSVVMDGRDIGTVVLPQAQVKIFLTASPEERARRRYEEHREKGLAVEYERILAEVKQRDYNDSNRAIAPLRKAEDALLVDTTGNTLEQSIALLTKLVKERMQ